MRGGALFGLVAVFALLGCAGGGARDVVPESHDVVADAGAAHAVGEGYDYVARRPLAVVGLAEARGLDAALARAAVDHLADQLDACVTEETRKRGPAEGVEGAARVVAQIGAGGDVTGTQVRVDPGTGSARSAVVCLVAPVKLLTFPPGTSEGRGIAIEAIWGHVAPAGPTPAGP
jgi:hypothetical protein